MKSKEIASQNGFDKTELENYIRKSSVVPFKDGFTGIVVEDSDVAAVVDSFKNYLAIEVQKRAVAKKAAEDEAAALEKAAEDKKNALARMLITSGFNFDGYTIKKYSGYISGDDAVQVARGSQGLFGGGATDVGSALMKSLVKIRRQALTELKEAAYALGCNAVIGVDFDYITLDPETANFNGGTLYLPYVFGVTANGNAVIIEKNGVSE